MRLLLRFFIERSESGDSGIFAISGGVIAVDYHATGERSNVLKAYTSPKAPDIISAISPISKKIRVRWRKSSGISGYQIMWSTSSDFSSNYKTVNALSKNTSAVITTAQSGKKYYVRMRAYRIRDGKKIYSPWSGRLYTKVK